jgi:uncharacterized Zn-finger protein
MNDKEISLLCQSRGDAFSVFLREMAEQNGKITCPICGNTHEYSLPDDRRESGPS